MLDYIDKHRHIVVPLIIVPVLGIVFGIVMLGLSPLVPTFLFPGTIAVLAGIGGMAYGLYQMYQERTNMLAMKNQELVTGIDKDTVSSYEKINNNLHEHGVSNEQTSLVDDILGSFFSAGNFFKELFTAPSEENDRNKELENQYLKL